MRARGLLLAGLLAVTGAGVSAQGGNAPAGKAGAGFASDEASDPFTFLEEIQGERALAWARNENTRTLGFLQGDARYQQMFDRALTILQARDRIPGVAFRPDG